MKLTAYNQVEIPAFMYGTAWKKERTTKLVEQALEAGFTAIDTANQLKHYDEARVGEALLEMQKKGITRDKLFLQTKFTSLDGQDNRLPYDPKASITEQVKQSMDSSLQHLHTEVIDSYVLHGPYSRYGLGAEDIEVWAAIESLYNDGKARMIGVSNVSAEQLIELCKIAKVKPMLVQNRCYAIRGWDQDVREICREHKIIYQGFSLLTANPHILSEAAVQAMAKRLNTGPAQVIFRFCMQIGMQVLTGTCDQKHMKEDLAVQDLSPLTDEEVQLIERIGLQARR